MIGSFEKEIADKTSFRSKGFIRNARTPKRVHSSKIFISSLPVITIILEVGSSNQIFFKTLNPSSLGIVKSKNTSSDFSE